ncbi:Maf family protein [Psychrobacter lutiphocae]|uniref:Maf family protein n=1 Tax=Psychrobacter lutiphocae TaxID=540500 RepID=UPI00037178F4|nr:Maf family protein [Psychrobacter lutiphocae]
MDIILASTSPRRHQLLSLADINFVTLAVDVDETILADERPQDYIVRMVQTKAQQACQLLLCRYNEVSQTQSNQNSQSDQKSHQAKLSHQTSQSEDKQECQYLIITADTIGVLADGQSILVKPVDKTDAFAMWQQMSGTEHSIWTAVQLTLVTDGGDVVCQKNLLEKTSVKFIALDEAEMQVYWETGEPQDKAGGYAIQGKGALWVERIEGSYSNVVGLPLAQTVAAIRQIQAQI